MTVDGARGRMTDGAFRRAMPAIATPGSAPGREQAATHLRAGFAQLGLQLAPAPALSTDVDYAAVAGATYVIENLLAHMCHHGHDNVEAVLLCVRQTSEDLLLAVLLVACGSTFGRGGTYEEATEAGRREAELAVAAAQLDDSLLDDMDPEDDR